VKKKFAFLIIVFLVLINFQSWTKAGDISDFEIEGISIGESLLEHFSEEEILANEVNYYDDDYFITSEFSGFEKFENYESINVSYKKKDKNYIIYALSGFNFYFDDIKKCYTDMREVDNEVRYLFKNLERTSSDSNHEADQSGNSTVREIRYWFKNDSLISIVCYNWSEKITKEKRWTDNLSLEIVTNEFNNWLINKAWN
jgi:hypothetical protein|tara:strand:- start:3343 stop:3942 length:600 start_codon:yes stop_codon:yes gene_type:complete